MDEIEEKYNYLKKQTILCLLDLLENDDSVDRISPMIIEPLAAKVQIDPNYYSILFPKGISEMMASLSDYLDQKILLANKQEKTNQKSIRGKIRLALELRIIDSTSLKAQRKIASYFSKIENLDINLKASLKTCNIIWQYAGDQSTDFNYYTKRALLLTVYKRALNFYLKDNSKDYVQTRKFIQNALDNIVNIASLKGKIKSLKKEDIPIIRLFS